MRIPFRPLALAVVTLALCGTFLQRAQAGGGHFYPPVADPVVREECGSCHLAFAPSMLPAKAWKQMMGDLANHFGSDASVAPDTVEQITRYLNDNAADTGGQRYAGKLMRGVSIQNPPLRITELPKWVQEHRKISPAEWKRKDIGSKSNCLACHTDAERGRYED
jgi:hypothetical protein